MLLAVLTVSRTCVSFQFQSLTPLVDFLAQQFGIGATGFGLLLGLYMAPGAVMAIVLPFLTKRLGDSNVLAVALAVMALGHVLLILTHNDLLAYGARLVSGIGGCAVYIATIDFAAKYCRAGERPGRMGLVASSWPFGNAISLIIVGLLAGAGMLSAAAYVPVVLCAFSVFMVLASERLFVASSEQQQLCHGRHSLHVVLARWQQALSLCWLPGLAFALYNIGFIIFVSFSTSLLTSQGYSSRVASSIASLPMWLFVISVPLGGLLAGRGRATAHALVALGCVGGALCIGASYVFEFKVFWYVAAGVCGGLPTGPMLSKVGRSEHTLFYPAIFLIFFVALLALPPLVGLIIDVLDDQRSAVLMAMLLVVSGWWLFIPSVRSGRSPG